jgi:hypothetical protein
MSELYYFTDNISEHYRFTPTPFQKVVGGNTYAPAAVQRSNVSLTDNFARSPVVFRFARTNVFALRVLNTIPETPLGVQILSSSGQVLWRGVVLKVTGKDNTSIDIHCDTEYRSNLGRGGNLVISNSCIHVLYSSQCGVNRFAHITFINNILIAPLQTEITIPTLNKEEDELNGGMVTLSGISRSIMKNTETKIFISQPFYRNVEGTLQIFPGCDLTEETCKNKFNNLDNYLGFPRLPNKNPYTFSGLMG